MQIRFTRVDFVLLLMVIFWGANIAIIKSALEHVDPMAFNLARFLLAAALLAVLYRKAFRDSLTRKEMLQMMLLGFLGNTVYQVFFILGVQYTFATHTSLLLAATPIFTAAISGAAGYERIGKSVWVGVGVSFLGVALIVLGNGQLELGDTRSLIGDLFIVFASLIFSFYTTFSRKILDHHSAEYYVLYTILFGTLFLIPISIPSVLSQNWSALTLYDWSAILYSGSMSLVFGYSAWYYAVERIGSTRTSAYSNLTPFAGLVVAMIFLKERLTLPQWVGAGFIFCGLALNRFSKTHRIDTPVEAEKLAAVDCAPTR